MVMTFLLAAVLGAAPARAADKDLSLCLDVATTLEAGGDVSDKDLAAAHLACEHARTADDPALRLKVNADSATVDDETRKRQAAHRAQ
jgi:hypothetical protein